MKPENVDPQIWHMAKQRASFKRHLTTYVLVNALFWVLWYWSEGSQYRHGVPWPVWPGLGWGIGVFFNYLGAYGFGGNGPMSTEREYEKLMRKRNQA